MVEFLHSVHAISSSSIRAIRVHTFAVEAPRWASMCVRNHHKHILATAFFFQLSSIVLLPLLCRFIFFLVFFLPLFSLFLSTGEKKIRFPLALFHSFAFHNFCPINWKLFLTAFHTAPRKYRFLYNLNNGAKSKRMKNNLINFSYASLSFFFLLLFSRYSCCAEFVLASYVTFFFLF